MIEEGDVLRVTARCVVDLVSDFENTFHWKLIDDASCSQAWLLVDILSVMDNLYKILDQDMANNMTFADISVYNVTKDEPYGAFVWPTLVAGGNVNSMLPMGTAVFSHAALGISKCRGKKWWGVFCEGHVNEGVWDSPILVICAAACTYLLAVQPGTHTSTWQNVIPHLWENGVELTVPEYIAPVGWYVSNNPGYQRRRRKGYGS